MFVLALFLAPTFVTLLLAHKFVTGVACWAIFSAVVDGMPQPTEDSGVFYSWLHASLNLLAANIFRMLAVLCPRFTTIFGKHPGDSQ